MLFNSFAATATWLGLEFKAGIAITDVARFWGSPFIPLSLPSFLPSFASPSFKTHNFCFLKSIS